MTSINRQMKLLIVDDEEEIRISLRKIFQKEGYLVADAADGQEALQKIPSFQPDVVLTDLTMPNMNGMELIRELSVTAPGIAVIVMTAYGTFDKAVEAMRAGAYDFITKPLQRQLVVKAVQLALQHKGLIEENRQLKETIATSNQSSNIIVNSPKMLRVVELIKQAAATDVTILLTGESGTGKEVMAQMIHQCSSCANEEFLAINCGAMPESILESALFGHEKGSFTGAHERHIGYFERADGGTLFLDEVGEMSPALQIRLLRVLQDGVFERVGGQKTIKVTTRIIAATNVDLEKAVQEGRFREDLFYRLNVVAVRLPALRERTEDIIPLAHHFMAIFAKKYKREINGLTAEAITALENYSWPGNVRELKNMIERAVALNQSNELSLSDLPEQLQKDIPPQQPRQIITAADEIRLPWGMTLAAIQDIFIEEALKRTSGDKKEAARILGINVRTIYRWLEEHPGKEN